LGTNFFRIPTHEEVVEKKNQLINRIENLDISQYSIEGGFRYIFLNDFLSINPWEEFMDGISIHLGKRSGGWKFLWNFNNNKYYSNKEELFSFIRSGRVVDEYGDEIDPDKFIDMALSWYVDGWDTQTFSKEHDMHYDEKYHDIYIDGLRVSSSTEFS
jgi:hypothetical protein